MAASKHLGIRDAVAALFVGLAGGRVHENRDLALPVDVASQIQVFRVQSVPERVMVGSTAPVDWTTDIRVLVKARSSGATSAEAAADDIACSVYAALMADQTLGGRCQLMDPGAFAWDQEEVDTSVVAVSFDIRLTHRTESHSIT
jgi:hypothetical protein